MRRADKGARQYLSRDIEFKGEKVMQFEKVQYELVDNVLTAVKGKEPFYEKLGFSLGSSGMKKWIDITGVYDI